MLVLCGLCDLGAEASFRIPAGTAPALPGALQGVQGLPGGMGTSAENKALLGLSAATPAVLDECLSNAAVCANSQSLSHRELKILLCISNLF